VIVLAGTMFRKKKWIDSGLGFSFVLFVQSLFCWFLYLTY
jgi:hypothetical protein